MLNLALELGYVKESDYIFSNNLSIEISKILSGFIKSIK